MTPERWHELWSVATSNEPDVSAIREAARESLLEVDRLRETLDVYRELRAVLKEKIRRLKARPTKPGGI